MTKENVKPSEEESEDLNPEEGDESEEELSEEDEDFTDEDFEEDETEEDEELASDDEESEEEKDLDYINKATGKNFTKEELVKYIKKVDKDYAQKKVEPTEEKKAEKKAEEVPSSIIERLLRVEQPLSALVMDEMKKVSEKTKQSLEELWEDETGYFKGKALAINEKAEASKRISVPSQNTETKEDDSEEKKMSHKFMDPSKLPPGFKFIK